MKLLTLLMMLISVTAFSADYWVTVKETRIYSHVTGEVEGRISAGKVYYGKYDGRSRAVLREGGNRTYRVYAKNLVSFSKLRAVNEEYMRLGTWMENAAAKARRYEELAAQQAPRTTRGSSSFHGSGTSRSPQGGINRHDFSGQENYSGTSTGRDYHRYRRLMNSYWQRVAQHRKRREEIVEKYGNYSIVMENFLNR